MDFIESLSPLLQTFWYVAIPTSFIFLIQTIITFTGMDGIDTDFDGDVDGLDTHFHFFSFRNLIQFLLGFSWTGISFYNTIQNQLVLIVLSIAVGCLFVYFFFIVIKQIQKLEEDNSFSLPDTLNKSAEVYLKIPANKSGKGKIMISIKGAFHELDAMTEADAIASGITVVVTAIENNSIIIVKPI